MKVLVLLLFGVFATAQDPEGACCNATLDCVEVTESNCTDDFIPGGFCDPNPCGPREACCQPDFQCFDLTPAQCDESPGTSAGNGTVCDISICLPEGIGACCTDECVHVPENECVPPAEYQGNGTICANQCQNEPGACCLPDGSCEDTTEANCESLEGAFEGRGTNCSATECPQPTPTPTPAPPVEPTDRTPYIIGIVVAVVVLFCCGIIIICVIYRRRPIYV